MLIEQYAVLSPFVYEKRGKGFWFETILFLLNVLSAALVAFILYLKNEQTNAYIMANKSQAVTRDVYQR